MSAMTKSGLEKLRVLLPMAGQAQRFKTVGVKTPKPLITVDGTPMIRRALTSIPALGKLAPDQFVAVVREEDVTDHDIITRLRAELGEVHVKIDPKPSGAASTVLVARDLITKDSPVLVMDCDICFESPGYEEAMCNPVDGRSGMIPVFDAKGDRWSFSVVKAGGQITEIIEKARRRVPCDFTLLANVGFYWFAKGSDLLQGCEKALDLCPEGKECYLSQAIGCLLAEGYHFHAEKCERVLDMGTPASHAAAEAEFARRRTGGLA